MAESELIENASHGNQTGNPLRDAYTPEVESDRSTAVYDEPGDDPMKGDADRGPSGLADA